jgi:hypothetical protein
MAASVLVVVGANDFVPDGVWPARTCTHSPNTITSVTAANGRELGAHLKTP